MQPYQILDGPRWLDTERWDVAAAGSTGTPDAMFLALQQLLGDRFSLVVRRERRELPVHALVVARSDGRLGPQLKRAAVDCAAAKAAALRTGVIPPEAKTRVPSPGSRRQYRDRWVTSLGRDTAPRRAAPAPSHRSHRPHRPVGSHADVFAGAVTDCRGALAPGAAPAIDPTGPSLFTAVQEQLGLQLESTGAPVEVLVIERAEFAHEN